MSETIANIIADMKENDGLAVSPLFCYNEDGGVNLGQLIDRLEAAYKAQLTGGTMCTMSCREFGKVIEQYAESERRLADENKRLKAALKPVLECRILREDGVESPDGEFGTSGEYGVCDSDGNAVDSHSVAEVLNAVCNAHRTMEGDCIGNGGC